jgi:L-alanine-DL-glutamate epimerase-like enolase superfamily enzyme
MILRPRLFTIHLRHSFTLASGSRTTTPAVLLEVEQDGVTGLGEASMPPYLGETAGEAFEFLNSLHVPRIDSYTELLGLLSEVDRQRPGLHAAKAALDMALHDWWARTEGMPCRAIWGLSGSDLPFSSMTIGMGDRDFLAARIAEARGFPVLKIKLGGSADREIVRMIRSVTDQPLRVDANQGWGDSEKALGMITWLAGEGVELVEQPMPKERVEDMRWLRERSPLPLVADESVVRYADLAAAAELFHGVNIKLMKCTGMAEAHRMILRAKELGLKVMLGCMTETTCGISAAAHLVQLADWADLDGALLIANDPFTGTRVEDGRIFLSAGPGLGVEWIAT